MIGFIIGRLRLRHIVALVSESPDTWLMASRASWRLFSKVFLGLISFLSKVPLYAFVCVSVDIFSPCMLNSTGTSRFSVSGSCLFAPRLASRSLPSLPLWPLVHWKVVFADRCLIRCVRCFLE